jgi:predicted nucleic acid-binding protein
VNVFLDSSALVKCYSEEQGALDTMALLDVAAMVAVSPLTRVEVTSALTRAVREGVLTARLGRDAYAAFLEEWPALIQVPVSEGVLGRAQELLWQSPLRAYDALQLASALVWRERLSEPVTFATFDARLAAAARPAGLDAWPPLTSAT